MSLLARVFAESAGRVYGGIWHVQDAAPRERETFVAVSPDEARPAGDGRLVARTTRAGDEDSGEHSPRDAAPLDDAEAFPVLGESDAA